MPCARRVRPIRCTVLRCMYKYEYKYIFAPSPAGLLAVVVPSRLPCAKPSGAETGNIRFRMAHRRAFHARPLPHSLTHSRTHSARRFQQKHHHPGTTLAHSHTKAGRPPAAHLPTTFLGLGCRPNLSLLSLSHCNLSLFSSLASRTATRNTPSSIASETASATASTHPRLSDCISDSSLASIRLCVPSQSLDTHFSPSNSLTSPAMRASAALVAFAAAAVSAQQNYTSELDMKIDPNTVQLQIRGTCSSRLGGALAAPRPSCPSPVSGDPFMQNSLLTWFTQRNGARLRPTPATSSATTTLTKTVAPR